MLKPAAMVDHLDRVFEAQNAGYMGGGHLAHTVSDDGVRLDAPGIPGLLTSLFPGFKQLCCGYMCP